MLKSAPWRDVLSGVQQTTVRHQPEDDDTVVHMPKEAVANLYSDLKEHEKRVRAHEANIERELAKLEALKTQQEELIHRAKMAFHRERESFTEKLERWSMLTNGISDEIHSYVRTEIIEAQQNYGDPTVYQQTPPTIPGTGPASGRSGSDE